MPTAQQITDFGNSVTKLNSDLSKASVNQVALDRSSANLQNAQTDVASKTEATTADATMLQADLDDINAKGLAMGLKVNVPAAAGAVVLNPPPGPVGNETLSGNATVSGGATE